MEYFSSCQGRFFHSCLLEATLIFRAAPRFTLELILPLAIPLTLWSGLYKTGQSWQELSVKSNSLMTASQLLSISPVGFPLYLFHPGCFYHQYARTESLIVRRDLRNQARGRDTSEFPRILNILPISLTLFLVDYEACDFKCSFLHMGKSNIYSYFSSTFNIFHVSCAGGNGDSLWCLCWLACPHFSVGLGVLQSRPTSDGFTMFQCLQDGNSHGQVHFQPQTASAA